LPTTIDYGDTVGELAGGKLPQLSITQAVIFAAVVTTLVVNNDKNIGLPTP
jgi:hypothetical protein